MAGTGSWIYPGSLVLPPCKFWRPPGKSSSSDRYPILLEPGVDLDDAFEQEGCGLPGQGDFSFCQGTEHGSVDKGLYGRVGIVENRERPLAQARFVGWVLRRGIGA